MHKIYYLFLASLLISACESVETRRPELNPNPKPMATNQKPAENKSIVTSEVGVNQNQGPSSATGTPEFPNQNLVTPPPTMETGDRPKVGLILGPGGLRAYAHIGVLQELLRAHVPIVAVVGLETGALVGGIYSAKGQLYDVEWQMMKLHEEDFIHKSLMDSGKPQDVSSLNGFLQTALGGARAEDAKISFACPSYNLDKRQVFMMSRGPLSSLLPFCIPFSPFYRPYQQSIASLTSLSVATKYLKSKGVNYLIYVDLLGEKTGPYFPDKESEENVEWSTVAEALTSQLGAVNKVISVPLTGLYVNDFAHRREMSQRGQSAGKAVTNEIINELGL